ncbi:MAG: glycosyltransferase [Candidatus Omnitrophica bacterium]|nr:glycosyltransferase [Candidatus Omnitrophota bacterium]
MLKVAYCTPWNIARDGIADYSEYLVAELRKNDLEVKILPLGYYISGKAFYEQLAKEANLCDICHIQFNYLYFNGEMPYRNMFIYFLRLVKVPVVITCHEVRLVDKAVIQAGKRDFRTGIYNNTLGFWRALSYFMHRKIFAMAHKIIVHTQSQLELARSLVEDKSKIIFLTHGIPVIPAADLSYDAGQAKKELGLENKRVLTIFGFVNTRKNYFLALDALKLLSQDVVLLIAGGPMTDNATDTLFFMQLQMGVVEAGLGERVKITGYIKGEGSARIMAATDIALALFSSDTGSGALSLYLAYHKPVIASNIRSHIEINNSIQCLDILNKNDPDELKSRTNFMLGNADKRKLLIKGASEYAREYSYSRIASRTARIYRELLH